MSFEIFKNAVVSKGIFGGRKEFDVCDSLLAQLLFKYPLNLSPLK